MESLGEQLVSVNNSTPRVYTGDDWTGWTTTRVVTNELSEETIHTPNHIIECPDSAWLPGDTGEGVTLFTWCESSGVENLQQTTSYYALRADNGAWIKTPTVLYTPSATNPRALTKVVTDGTYFWLFWTIASSFIGVQIVDVNGVGQVSTILNMTYALSPGYWDVIHSPNNVVGNVYPILLAQPTSTPKTTSTDVNWTITALRWVPGGPILTTSNTAGHCSGPIAWLENDTGNGLAYLATTTGTTLRVAEITSNISLNFTYSFGAIAAIPDSITGWVSSEAGGIKAWVAYSILSNFSPSSGPPNDPGLRYIRVLSQTRSAVQATVRQDKAVLLQSRAFRIDDDRHAVSFYQSGGGLTETNQTVTHACTTGDTFYGQQEQNKSLFGGSVFTGAPQLVTSTGADILPTQAQASITHNAGDGAVASTQTWTFLNSATFVDTPSAGAPTTVGSILTISGSAVTHNNTSYRVIAVVSAHVLKTELIGANGFAMQNDTLVGVTASLSSRAIFLFPYSTDGTRSGPLLDGKVIPDGMASYFSAGSISVAGSPNPGNNTSYPIEEVFPYTSVPSTWSFSPVYALCTIFYTNPGIAITYEQSTSAAITISPTTPYMLRLPGTTFSSLDVGQDLIMTLATGANSGTFSIDSLVDTNTVILGGTSITGTVPEFIIPGDPTVEAIVEELVTSPPLTFHLTSFTFDQSYVGSFLVMTGGSIAVNNGVYVIQNIIDSHTVTVTPATGQTGQINQDLDNEDFTPSVSILRSNNAYPGVQPTWFLTPLSLSNTDQQVAGRWEYGIAYADWRFDGAPSRVISINPADNVVIAGIWQFANGNFSSRDVDSILLVTGATNAANNGMFFIRQVTNSTTILAGGSLVNETLNNGVVTATVIAPQNRFSMALSSVPVGENKRQVILPYRAQSFTAGQTSSQSAEPGQNLVGVQETTVGLRQFNISDSSGQAVPNSGELLLPGMQATEFSESGFHEDNVSVAPETPFYISQSHDGSIIAGLTGGITYFYQVVFEDTDDNGDRIFSAPTQSLKVPLASGNNTIVIGGRMPNVSNRTNAISIYRTATVNGVPTDILYKITNDLDINGSGFSFSIKNGGSLTDTWTFTDQVPDATILSAEQLYTGKGYLPRYPAPAFSQGVGSWCNRTWVIGYDGAIWMSGEKTEGDAVWFNPLFRYVLPTDDKPVAICPMDQNLIIFCSSSIWRIPQANFRDATNTEGSNPTPVQLTTFTNGCTGFAKPIRNGVAYSSTAGGVWMVTRSFDNYWLGQPVRDSLSTITGMALDQNQRLLVSTGTNSLFVYDQITASWYEWVLPSTTELIANYQGNPVYQDSTNVNVQVPGSYVDAINGVTSGINMDFTLNPLSFAGVRNMKRVWEFQLVGEYKGPHSLNVELGYPDQDEPTTAFPAFVPSATSDYVYPFNPMVEESSTYSVRVYTTNATGQTMTLEFISAEVGLDPGAGLNKLPNSKRIGGG